MARHASLCKSLFLLQRTYIDFEILIVSKNNDPLDKSLKISSLIFFRFLSISIQKNINNDYTLVHLAYLEHCENNEPCLIMTQLKIQFLNGHNLETINFYLEL